MLESPLTEQTGVLIGARRAMQVREPTAALFLFNPRAVIPIVALAGVIVADRVIAWAGPGVMDLLKEVEAAGR